MNAKFLVLLILSIVMGIGFVVVSFYFSSQKYISRLNEASPEKSEEAFRKNAFRAKGSSIVSLVLGILTIVWGIVLFIFPQISGPLALFYMIVLIIAFLFLSFVFK